MSDNKLPEYYFIYLEKDGDDWYPYVYETELDAADNEEPRLVGKYKLVSSDVITQKVSRKIVRHKKKFKA